MSNFVTHAWWLANLRTWNFNRKNPKVSGFRQKENSFIVGSILIFSGDKNDIWFDLGNNSICFIVLNRKSKTYRNLERSECFMSYRSRNSVVGVVTSLWVRRPRNRVRIPLRLRDFSFLLTFQIGGGRFQVGEGTETSSWPFIPSSDVVKNEWSHTYADPYAFMAWAGWMCLYIYELSPGLTELALINKTDMYDFFLADVYGPLKCAQCHDLRRL